MKAVICLLMGCLLLVGGCSKGDSKLSGVWTTADGSVSISFRDDHTGVGMKQNQANENFTWSMPQQNQVRIALGDKGEPLVLDVKEDGLYRNGTKLFTRVK